MSLVPALLGWTESLKVNTESETSLSISFSVCLQDPTLHGLEWAPRMQDPGAIAGGGLTSSLLWESEHGLGVSEWTRRVPNSCCKTDPAWLHPSLSDGPPPPNLSSKRPTQTLRAFWRRSWGRYGEEGGSVMGGARRLWCFLR